MPEVAFIGRSNVGKSSLINALTGRKELAKTSGTPGKTQLINHFVIGNTWYLVDLPGYGFAKVGHRQRETFEAMIWDYLRQRPTLLVLLVLIDIRHAPMAIDLEFLTKLGTAGIPFVIVFTKADKLSNAQQQKATALYTQTLAQHWEPLPTFFVTSAENGQGCSELLSYLTHNVQDVTS